MRARVLGRLRPEQAEEARAWCEEQPLASVTGSSYVRGRLERWYEVGSNLQSVAAGRARLFLAAPLPPRLRAFGDRHLPGWASVLVCGGPTSIGWHRDHAHFEAQALMLNLGRAEFWEQEDPRRDDSREPLILDDGDVVLLDTKVLHMSRQLCRERFHVTWRRIKPQYLRELAIDGPARPPTRVVHRREPHDVYIGRPSKWGNPFSHKAGTLAEHRVASVGEAIARYEEWIRTQPHLLADLGELRGRVLGCWCKPGPCHGDVLARLADELDAGAGAG